MSTISVPDPKCPDCLVLLLSAKPLVPFRVCPCCGKRVFK